MFSTRTFRVFGLVVALLSVTSSAEKCAEKCEESYKSTVIEFPESKASCKRGCRLFELNDGVLSVNPFLSDTKGALARCKEDCQNSFEDQEAKVKSCQAGCSFQAPESKERKQNTLDNAFQVNNDGRRGFTIAIPIPRFVQDNAGVPNTFIAGIPSANNLFDHIDQMFNDHLGATFFGSDKKPESKAKTDDAIEEPTSIFDQMHQRMQNMMNWMMGGSDGSKMMGGADGSSMMNDMMSELGGHGKGKLVVIRDGPGFHEEKTYNIGPDSNVQEILNKGMSDMNDMMDKANPLEKFLTDKDVEVFDPSKINKDAYDSSSSEEDDDSHEDDGKTGFSDLQVFGPFVVGSAPNEVDSNTIHGFDFQDALDGPRLPENGLRSRPLSDLEGGDNSLRDDLRRFVFVDESHDICNQENSKMKWADWVACLHLRHGLPRWLTAATICLGIIFALWLCLVIPSNAPKQKVKKQKKNIDTKEVEALNNPHLAIIEANQVYPLDLPPSYDDVTGRPAKVKIEPVHGFAIKIDEAGPLPEKKPINEEA